MFPFSIVCFNRHRSILCLFDRRLASANTCNACLLCDSQHMPFILRYIFCTEYTNCLPPTSRLYVRHMHDVANDHNHIKRRCSKGDCATSTELGKYGQALTVYISVAWKKHSFPELTDNPRIIWEPAVNLNNDSIIQCVNIARHSKEWISIPLFVVSQIEHFSNDATANSPCCSDVKQSHQTLKIMLILIQQRLIYF